MALPSPHLMTVRIAPGGDPDDPSTWAALWVDITSKVRQEQSVTITAGRGEESGSADASTCVMTLDNADGRFSPRNAEGAYYPDLTRNTPLQVRWDTDERFVGFVSEWPPRWDLSGNDAFVTIQADGVLRRLRQRTKPLRSALFRDTTATTPAAVAYWPCEDPAGATTASSSVGGTPLLPYEAGTVEDGSTVVFGSDLHTAGSVGAAVLPRNWGLAASFAPGASTGWTWEAWVDFGAAASAARSRWTIDTPGPGRDQRVRLEIFQDVYAGTLFDENASQLGVWAGVGITEVWPNGDLIGSHHIAVTASDSGSAVTYKLYLDGVEVDTANHTVDLNAASRLQVSNTTATDVDIAASHVTVWGSALSATAITDRTDAGTGFAGETAADRISRLCTEESVPITIVGTAADTTAMGPQLPGVFLDLLFDAEAADGGILHEDGGGLGYRTRTNRYNQAATLAIDIQTNHHVADAPVPVDDDRHMLNDLTLQRERGATVNITDDTHIGKNGLYDASLTVNVEEDSLLANIASWLVHLGTVDEMRWPHISLQLHRHPDLITTWLTLSAFPGKRLTVNHTITQLPGVDIDLLVDGWTEHIGEFRWDVELNCVPASPWKVGVLDGTDRRPDGDSTLASAVTSTATSLSVATASGPLWTTSAGDMPFEIEIGGERMSVTAISGASSPQTFTVTRSVNGVVKSHSAGAAVHASPFVVAR